MLLIAISQSLSSDEDNDEDAFIMPEKRSLIIAIANICTNTIIIIIIRVVNPEGLGRSRPPDFGQGGRGRVAGGRRGGSWGSWTGREILLYLIMYRKYVRKW